MAASNDRFNLINLLNQRSKENASQEAKTAEKSVAMSAESAMADIYDLIPSKDNFYSTEDIQDLKQSIELLGILQPLLVTDEGGGKFRIIAGHRRRLAAMQLAEEGREHFRRVPVMIRPSKNAILDRLALIMTNRFREKTEWEKMTETIETKNLVRELKEQMDIPGRTRELLSEIIGTSFAQIGRYEAIYNNLEADLMTEFKAGKIGITVAYEASGLKKEGQLNLLEMLRNNNTLTLADVKEAKRQQETQEAENTENGRNSGEREEAAAEDAEEKQEDNSEASTHDKEGGTGQEGYIDPTPESVISICYSCTQYETCHDKKATVTSCNAYSNRQEAYKTDDQRYDEEQTKIDAETKKKLRERQQEETVQQEAEEVRGKKEIKLSPTKWKGVINGQLSFLLLKKDGFKTGEELRMTEYANGSWTGREFNIRICYIWEDCTGLDDDYCIIGLDWG